MALCSECSRIDLESESVHILQNSRGMKASADGGCPGCEFYFRAARDHLGVQWTREAISKANLYVDLKRLSENGNRVDLRFGSSEANVDTARGTVPLRLCSVYGLEPAWTAEYEGADEQFPARSISQTVEDPECLDLAAGWIERCSRFHGGDCRPQEDVLLPTRLVHIPLNMAGKLQLRSTEGLTGRYVTLSYCWGAGTPFSTTRETFKEREEGFEVELLPKTLQDAVIISRRLGFEYIWIDALCIVQGDSVDWSRESSRMANVYGKSSLTLCADLAYSADDGIFQPRNTLRSHTFGPYGAFCLQTRGAGWPAMTRNALYRRGWALQERLLSPRMLHFFQEQVAWECRTTLYMEEFRGHLMCPMDHFSIALIVPSLNLSGVISTKNAYGQLRTWRVATQELTLPSLSGFASAIEIPALGRSLAGIWENYPFMGMVWYTRFGQFAQRVYRAPSWSWASVDYQTMQFDATYPDPAVSAAVMADWNRWASTFNPILVSYNILLKSSDLKGEVLPGSSLVVRARCRDIYIMDDPDSTSFDPWEFIEKAVPGSKVHLDVRNDCESLAFFAEDLEDAIDRERLTKYICLQIARERRSREEWPKTVALLLEEVEDEDAEQVTGNTFRRVGLYAFEMPPDGDCDEVVRWEERTLTLV